VTRDVRTHVRPHLAVPDRDAPPDHKGRRVCRCGLPIIDGDPRHTVPPHVPDAREKAAHDEVE
jgi:hypothetical protein